MRRNFWPLCLLTVTGLLFAQEGTHRDSSLAATVPLRAWIDLRQNAKAGAVQTAPAWVESITLIAAPKNPGADSVTVVTAANTPRTIFRISLKKPGDGYTSLFFRLMFNDRADARPEIVAWDGTRSQLLRFGPLGAGIDVESSDAVIIPMEGVKNIDVEVPGDGRGVRSAFLEWMTTSEMLHAPGATTEKSIAQPFSPSVPLQPATEDTEQFGTVTASLSGEAIRIGSKSEEGATFQFGIEAQPLIAMLSFEIAAPQIDAAPEIVVNGTDLGAASLVLPELADPGYQGEMRALLHEMQFHYTGWIRAQKIVPARLLQTGMNDITVINGASAGSSVIRATQIQLKYLWDKSDYILKPED
jgi:hypothetical protein